MNSLFSVQLSVTSRFGVRTTACPAAVHRHRPRRGLRSGVQFRQRWVVRLWLLPRGRR